jgi:ATPase subunit of ABC transporter with duplicated ATPase domains
MPHSPAVSSVSSAHAKVAHVKAAYLKAPYLKAVALGHHYDGDLLFSGLSLILGRGDRIGLVGPNGAGKTTLLRLLAGQLRPAAGHVTTAPGTRIGWATDQHDPAQTVGCYLAEGLGRVAALTQRMRELEAAIARSDATASAEETLAEYGSVQDEWTALQGWTADSKLAAVRDRLGLRDIPDDRPLGAVSGGELARLGLARLLLTEPDVLVLDEPTNHLDADGAEWLGDYLARFGGGVLAASHDRAFLDRAVTQIIELDGIDPEPARYQGGYTEYRQEKQRRWERRLLDFEAQQKYRTRLEADIGAVKQQALRTELSTTNDRLRRYAKKVAKKAKARERRLERQIESVRWLAEPESRQPLVLAIPAVRDAGAGAVSARGVSVRAGDRDVLRDVDLTVQSGDRVLVSGSNGAGKSTLLNVLGGRLAPDAGQVSFGEQPALLSQGNDGLPPTMTVLGFLRSRLPMYVDDAEQLLTAYLFGRDQWGAQLRTLSQGELRRLQLAVAVNSGAPALLLDEPTHYLDFDALDVVEEALREYPGTLVLVTHDMYFAARVGYGRHWRVGNGRVTEGERKTP